MARSTEEFATSDKVDWDRHFVWIQETSLLKVVRKDDRSVEALRHDGSVSIMDLADAESRYFPIRDGRYLKPVYRPCRAHVLAEDQDLISDTGTATYPAGSAILRRDDGFVAIHRDILMRDYEAVSEPSDSRFPELPFCR